MFQTQEEVCDPTKVESPVASLGKEEKSDLAEVTSRSEERRQNTRNGMEAKKDFIPKAMESLWGILIKGSRAAG